MVWKERVVELIWKREAVWSESGWVLFGLVFGVFVKVVVVEQMIEQKNEG